MKASLVERNPKVEKQKKEQNFKTEETKEQIRVRLFHLYPIGLVPRSEIERATGGIFKPQTMSNMDGRGDGIEGSVVVGGKKCYTVDGIIDFIFGRIKDAA